jgi:hypothetical protein
MSKVIFSGAERYCGGGVGGRHLRHGWWRLGSRVSEGVSLA